jgi:hypothetical protein
MFSVFVAALGMLAWLVLRFKKFEQHHENARPYIELLAPKVR